jgi:hypothetical protein
MPVCCDPLNLLVAHLVISLPPGNSIAFRTEAGIGVKRTTSARRYPVGCKPINQKLSGVFELQNFQRGLSRARGCGLGMLGGDGQWAGAGGPTSVNNQQQIAGAGVNAKLGLCLMLNNARSR